MTGRCSRRSRLRHKETRFMRNRSFFFATLLTLFIAGCSASDGGSSSVDTARVQTIESLTVDLTSGKTLFDSNCASCHGTDGKSGSERIDAAAIAAGSATTALEAMLAGKEEMPSFSSLDNQSLANILGYLQSLN